MAPETELVGFLAGTLTTLCWTPQAVKILRSRDAKSISMTTQATFVVGCMLWLIYGVLIGSLSIVLFNAITIALNALIILLKLRYDARVVDNPA
ncbi:SemiSWEET transporter [Rhodoblastus acidophilus]|uniref:SemiSWEET transporter n=1 Tax=Candidatus Rhodoblastus alkanivorans TaxID=2954117 RepID=A0ABS9Z1A2_9HYPH|nr:SemiSWEET transporter [Candidatus Rhodoblastus alkanivorans]MCI4679426.1 SemiSWEET transporter [Candidatus Rhodoblastus alkanivorans]MCI4681434.1 SemiSWEET transporter [Candidatus Rhodoblastus alkanivorans]MDI4642482.1 SemiSWEET transporter [Rhodoblastus acidophilus]